MNRFSPVRTLALLGLAGILLATNTSCSGDSDEGTDFGPPPVFAAVDPSKVCSAGYVGWDFATGGEGNAIPDLLTIKSYSCSSPAIGIDGRVDNREETNTRYACERASGCKPFPCYKNAQGSGGVTTMTYTCGTDPKEITVTEQPEQVQTRWYYDGNVLKSVDRLYSAPDLSCKFRASLEEGPRVATPTGKACVPATCPETTTRDAAMNCVPVIKMNAMDTVIAALSALPTQNTVADAKTAALVGETEYQIGAFYGFARKTGGFPQGRTVLWVSDEFAPKAGMSGGSIHGFRCTIGAMDMGPSLQQANSDNAWSRNTFRPSPECTADATEPVVVADAARRAEMSVDAFKVKYQRKQVRLHASIDLEGVNIFSSAVTSNFPSNLLGCSPNPPGFFIKNAGQPNAYMDWFGFYRQREWSRPFLDPRTGGLYAEFERWAPLANNEGVPWGTAVSAKPTSMRLASKELRINDPEITVAAFGVGVPTIPFNFTYSLAGGDNQSNPYSFTANVAGVKNLGARNLAVGIYLSPSKPTNCVTANGATSCDDSFSMADAMLIGTTTVGNGIPTGTTIAGNATMNRKKVKRFFDDLKDVNVVRAFACIQSDDIGAPKVSPKTQFGPALLPTVTNNGIGYNVGIDQTCVIASEAIAIQRDYTKSPLVAASADEEQENLDEKKSGNDKAEGKQGNASETACTGATCSRSQTSSMGGSGLFGRTFFSTTADATETENADGSGTATRDVEAEALGFQIVDLPDDGNGKWADASSIPPAGISFSVSPNFQAIKEALKKATTGTNVEASTGRYGGKDGIGIAFGYKAPVQIGPIPGMVNIAIGAGVSVSLKLEIKFKAADAYPCLNPAAGTRKCYAMTGEKKTQSESRGECAKVGGILSEPRSDQDFTDVRKFIADSGETNVWLGGQVAFQYADASCSEAADAAAKSTCATNATLRYKWLSDDRTFATSASGLSTPTIASDASFLSGYSSLAKLTSGGGLAEAAGVKYETSSARLKAQDNAVIWKGVCEFEPATKESYLSFGGGIELGAAAGVKIGFCTPSEDIGICLEASIAFIDIKVGYEAKTESRRITRRSDSRIMKVGGVSNEVPWSLNVLAGKVAAIFNFFFASAEITIVEWPGFKVASGSLFSSYKPVVERP